MPLPYLLILVLLVVASTPLGAADRQEGWRGAFLAHAYQEALEVFHPEALTEDLDPDGDTPWRGQLLADLENAAERAEHHGLAGDPIPPEILDVMERLLLPHVWELYARDQHLPGGEALEEWFRERSGRFAIPEMIRGARLIVQHGPGDAATVRRVEEMLKSDAAAGRPFRETARRYYRSLGIDTDGDLGWRTAGNLREDVFDAFLGADPEAHHFGPIETSAGHLFGSLDEKREGRARSFDEARDDVEQAWLAEHFPDHREQFFSAQEIARGLERQWPAAGLEDIPASDSTAFFIDGEPVTWGEVVTTTPGDFGDPEDPAYYPAVAERAIRNRLIYTGEVAGLVRETERFGELLDAVKAQWRIGNAIQAKLRAMQPETRELMDFHARNQERLYRAPDRYHVAAWSLPSNPGGLDDPAQAEAARIDAWRRANLLREEIDGSIPLEGYTLDEERFGPLRQAPDSQWMDATMFPPLVLEALEALAEKGELPAVTPPLIGARTYYIVYLVEWEQGRLLDFADVIDRLWHDWRDEREKEIRRRLAPANGGE